MSQMKLKFWGVRGSRPTHKKELLGYGGNSTSLEFLLPEEDFCLFIDGGSGLAKRPNAIESPIRKYYFLVTHTHWDHILGFPFFKPFYNPDIKVDFFSSKTSKATFNDLFLGLQKMGHMPIPPDALKAKISFNTIVPDEAFFIEQKVKISTYQINHQGITLAYRLDYYNDSVAIVTDNAPIEDGNYMGENMKEKAEKNPKAFENEFNDGLVKFLTNCNTVVFDTHFTEENLKADWGHSTPQRAMRFCLSAGVKRLILFHHAPEDIDNDVNNKVKSIRKEAASKGLEVVAAKEGDEWILHYD